LARSFDVIAEFLRKKIIAKNKKIKTHRGSSVSDVVIEGPAEEFSRLYEKAEEVSLNQALETSNPEGLKSLGINENKRKKAGVPATVDITFFSNTAPVSDINIPINTIVTTRVGISSLEVKFRTLRNSKMYASLANTYINSETGKYEITVEAEALVAGKNGNVGAYNINSIVNPITGINGCYNALAASGGTDVESDDAFRQRLAIGKRGNTIGTTDGLLSIVLENEDVEDAVLVGSRESTREEIGAIDIYVKGLKVTQFTDTFSADGNVTQFIFTKQPVTYSPIQVFTFSDDSVVSPSYSLVKDTAGYGGSVAGLDKIVWASALDPDLGNGYVIYSYNSLIEELQNLFNESSKDLQNTDILVHWAREIAIDLTFSIRLLQGFDESTVKSEINDNLSSYFSQLRIGEEVQQSDVAGIIINTSGVDDIILPLSLFRSSDSTILQNSLGNLSIPNSAYASLGTVIIDVVIT